MEKWIECLASVANVGGGSSLPGCAYGGKGVSRAAIRHKNALSKANALVSSSLNEYAKKTDADSGFDDGLLLLRQRKGEMVPTMTALCTLRAMGLELRDKLATLVDAYTAYAAVVAAVDEVHSASLPDLPTSYGRLHVRFRRCRKRRTKWRPVDSKGEKCVSSVHHMDTIWMQRLNNISTRLYGCSICLSDASSYMDVANTATATQLPDDMLYSDEDEPKGKQQRMEEPPSSPVLQRTDRFVIPPKSPGPHECSCVLCGKIYSDVDFYGIYFNVTAPAAIRYSVPHHSAQSMDDAMCPECLEQVHCTSCFESGKNALDLCTCDGHLLYLGKHQLRVPRNILWNVLTRNLPLEALPAVDGWSRKWSERYIDYLVHPVTEEFLEEQENPYDYAYLDDLSMLPHVMTEDTE